MTKLVLLVAVVIACHPEGGPARHPDAPAGQSQASDIEALSAKSQVYASFFYRLKHKVAQNWDPNGVWRRIDPERTVYGTATRRTEVRVSLSPSGELADILVTVSSGVKELDDEGVRAFRAAAPFVEPPEGLVQADGRITFAFSLYWVGGPPPHKQSQPAGPP